MYPPGVAPLCGAELEAWYEDLQDILGSDAGGAKHTRPPPCAEKEPEFLDVLESCSLTWLTEGQVWGEGVHRVMEEPSATPLLLSQSPAQEEQRSARETTSSGAGDLLPPEFFELLSEGGVSLVETGAVMVTNSYHHPPNLPPASPSVSEEELSSVPNSSPSCSSSSSLSPSLNCSPSSSPPLSPPAPASSCLGKRKKGSALASPFSGKKSRKEREQENERKVQELTDQNERLKAEIERLGEEVQRTRRALIERLVNTRK